jgi:putative hydrolase of HD superfamily
MTLSELQAFNGLLLQFQNIERVVWVPGKERRENDVEHSYQLAMLAWYIVENDVLPLAKDLVLQYALVHDLVEAHAGDVFFYSDERTLAEKKKRERAAAGLLKKDFPGFETLHKLIEAYEVKADPESRFVYALDKVLPMLNIYADGGRTWRTDNITLAMLIEKKRPILSKIPELKPYFEELVVLLEKQPELFSASEPKIST